MSNLVIHRAPHATMIALPAPRSAISIRDAEAGAGSAGGAGGADLHFIDELMKEHSHMVGFATTAELQSHIENGTALIAEDADTRQRIGYVLYKDKYHKREDCGNVSQLNVVPGKQRGLVGAALIKAMFERLPYGVRLFCCWCAQDLQANHFWEALGFVPLAFRTGSRGRAHGGSRKETRMHIFWQRRVREGDEYPYWFPSQTNAGRLGEARIVLPIPPGTHWSDAKPSVLPGAVLPGPPTTENLAALPEGDKPKRERKPRAKAPPVPPVNPISASGGLWFAPPTPTPPAETVEAKPKPKRPRMPKQKNDPKLVAAAREFRDRYLDEVNSGRMLPESTGKYDVSRQLAPGAAPRQVESMPLLNAA